MNAAVHEIERLRDSEADLKAEVQRLQAAWITAHMLAKEKR